MYKRNIEPLMEFMASNPPPPGETCMFKCLFGVAKYQTDVAFSIPCVISSTEAYGVIIVEDELQD